MCTFTSGSQHFYYITAALLAVYRAIRESSTWGEIIKLYTLSMKKTWFNEHQFIGNVFIFVYDYLPSRNNRIVKLYSWSKSKMSVYKYKNILVQMYNNQFEVYELTRTSGYKNNLDFSALVSSNPEPARCTRLMMCQ